jgi:HlyD family secretion protein
VSAVAVTQEEMPAKSHRWSRIALLLLAVSLVVYGAYLLWPLTTTAGDGANAPVARWIAPEMRTVQTTVNATGTVKLRTGAEVRVGAQVSGIVDKLFVAVGSRVNKGDIVAEIDSRAVRAAVAQARAQFAHDEAALAKAELDDNRMERLAASGAVSTQQVDDARAALRLAQATADVSRSGLDAAGVTLSYVSIRAPIAGTVSSVATQQGETVAAAFATPTFVTIIADGALEVIAMVDEADIGAVRMGDGAAFTTETYPDVEFSGHVVRIAPVATIVSGVVNYEVAIAIDGDMSRLKPDMTTNVTIQTASHNGLFVPAAAVRQGANGKFVVLRGRDGERLVRRVVTAGRKADGVEVANGLSPTDRVLVEN